MSARPLVVRLRNWVGDVILSVPALRLLQSHGYALELVGKGWAAALLAGEGWPVHARPPGLRARVAQLRALGRGLRHLDPGFAARENALVLPPSFSAALEMRLAGLRAVGHAAEGRSPLLSRVTPALHEGHELVRTWTLACRFLRIEAEPPAAIGLRTLEADQARADALLAARGVRAGFVVICPFAGGQVDKQDKTWPAFAEFSRVLRGRGRDVVACPGPGEASIIANQYPGVMPLDGVDLGTYGAVLRRAALMVSNDTGPAHLGAAVGAPVLAVLGPTRAEQWAPWGPRVEVVQRQPGWPSAEAVLARVHARLLA